MWKQPAVLIIAAILVVCTGMLVMQNKQVGAQDKVDCARQWEYGTLSIVIREDQADSTKEFVYAASIEFESNGLYASGHGHQKSSGSQLLNISGAYGVAISNFKENMERQVGLNLRDSNRVGHHQSLNFVGQMGWELVTFEQRDVRYMNLEHFRHKPIDLLTIDAVFRRPR